VTFQVHTAVSILSLFTPFFQCRHQLAAVVRDVGDHTAPGQVAAAEGELATAGHFEIVLKPQMTQISLIIASREVGESSADD